MATRIQLRRGTTAQWTAANPILAEGEQGFETDTKKKKIGDGATAWTALEYEKVGDDYSDEIAALELSKAPKTLTGDLVNLSTENKTNLVAAINEVLAAFLGANNLRAEDIDTLAEINAILNDADVASESFVENLTGALSGLSTTVKTNLVAAINDLAISISNKADQISVDEIKADLYTPFAVAVNNYEPVVPKPIVVYSNTTTYNYTGYGFPIGTVVNFESITVKVNASINPPTEFRVVIHENNRSGAILANQLFSKVIAPGVDTEITFDFDARIVNPNNQKIWLEIRGNDAFGMAHRTPATLFTEAAGYDQVRVSIGADNVDAKPISLISYRDFWVKMGAYVNRIEFSEQAAKSITYTADAKKTNFIKRVGDVVYISSKFDSTRDWLAQFEKCMANDLYTFRRIGLISNANIYLDRTKIDSTPETTINIASSDNIGPVNITGFGFIGANHTLNDDGVTKTAETNSFQILADGNKVLDGDSFYCDEVLILVENTIFDPALLPAEDPFIKEYVSYRIKNCNIEVTLKHEYLKAMTIAVYYGMQSVGNSNFTKIYYGHSQYPDLVDKVAGDSGANTAYPNVEKMVLSNADKSICQSMLLNKSRGLGANTGVNIINLPLAFCSGTGPKSYFRLIQNKSYTAGQSNFWNGTYSWFNQLEKESLEANTVFVYDSLQEGERVVLADFKGIESQIVRLLKNEGKFINTISKDETISANNFQLPGGFLVESEGLGAISFKAGSSQKDKEYITDIDFKDTSEFVFKAPETMIITVEEEPGTTATITGYTEGQVIQKYGTFTITVDVPGLVTLRGIIQ